MKDTIFYLTEWMEASYQRRDFAQDDMCEFAEWYHQKREQERQDPAPDRDELAMTMPMDSWPKLKTEKILVDAMAELGIDTDHNDTLGHIKASLEYDARVRYMYADAILKARKIEPV